MSVQVNLQIRPKGSPIESHIYEGSKELFRNPTLRQLEDYIRQKAFPGIFDGFGIRITLWDEFEELVGGPDAKLTQLGVPLKGAVLVISKVFLSIDFFLGFLCWC